MSTGGAVHCRLGICNRESRMSHWASDASVCDPYPLGAVGAPAHDDLCAASREKEQQKRFKPCRWLSFPTRRLCRPEPPAAKAVHLWVQLSHSMALQRCAPQSERPS